MTHIYFVETPLIKEHCYIEGWKLLLTDVPWKMEGVTPPEDMNLG
jgi:hypothetical protein